MEVQIYCNPTSIPYDLYRSPDAYYLVVDLPGVVPNREFFVQTDDIGKIYVKGERRFDLMIPHGMELSRQRHFGHFIIELTLPQSVEFGKTEQTFSNGVLTVRCPLKENSYFRNGWRAITEEMVDLAGASVNSNGHPVVQSDVHPV